MATHDPINRRRVLKGAVTTAAGAAGAGLAGGLAAAEAPTAGASLVRQLFDAGLAARDVREQAFDDGSPAAELDRLSTDSYLAELRCLAAPVRSVGDLALQMILADGAGDLALSRCDLIQRALVRNAYVLAGLGGWSEEDELEFQDWKVMVEANLGIAEASDA